MSNTPITRTAGVTATPVRALKNNRTRAATVTPTPSRGPTAFARTRVVVVTTARFALIALDTRLPVGPRPTRFNVFSDD